MFGVNNSLCIISRYAKLARYLDCDLDYEFLAGHSRFEVISQCGVASVGSGAVSWYVMLSLTRVCRMAAAIGRKRPGGPGAKAPKKKKWEEEEEDEEPAITNDDVEAWSRSGELQH